MLPQCTRYTGESVLLLGVGGLRWGEAIALRVADVDFLRRRIELHRNAVYVDGEFIVGTPQDNKSRTVVVPQFVTDALASTAHGKGREDLLWTAPSGGYLRPPGRHSWLVYAVARCQAADPSFPGSPRTPYAIQRPRWPSRRARIPRWCSGCSGMPARP